MDFKEIIIKPLFTEKSNNFRANNVYVFQVDKKTNKVEIKQALKKLFGVDVVDCRIINLKGKVKRTRLGTGTTNSKKKAIVQLKENQKISAFE